MQCSSPGTMPTLLEFSSAHVAFLRPCTTSCCSWATARLYLVATQGPCPPSTHTTSPTWASQLRPRHAHEPPRLCACVQPFACSPAHAPGGHRLYVFRSDHTTTNPANADADLAEFPNKSAASDCSFHQTRCRLPRILSQQTRSTDTTTTAAMPPIVHIASCKISLTTSMRPPLDRQSSNLRTT